MTELAKPQIWDLALAIDVDRSVINVDNCVKVLQLAYEQHRVRFELPEVNLVRLQSQTEDTLNSFSPYSVVQELTTDKPEAFNSIFDRFVRLGRSEDFVVYKDTHPFVDYITQRGIPMYLNTRGIEYEWQRYKVAAARLGPLPIALTTANDKGAELYRTRVTDGNGTYYAPQNVMLRDKHFAVAARRIYGLDDYRSSLRNWPADCPAVWLDRKESRNNQKQLDQASIQLPPNVQRIETLYEFIDLLETQNY